jgi:hypothetical protein
MIKYILYLKKKLNLSEIYLIIFVILLYNYNLFFNGNIFSQEDAYTVFDFRLNNQLSGWRFDIGLGQSLLPSDPFSHPWSILNIFYKLPFDKVLIHNVIYLSLLLYSCLSIYFLIRFSNKKISNFFAAILSTLLVFSSFKSEFLYCFYYITTIPGVCLSTIILFNYFKTGRNINIYYYFFNLFLVFHLGSIIALQQTFLFNLIFFILYSKYHNNFYIINFLKINLLALVFLIFSSLWIIYPSLLYLGDYERSSYYKFAPFYSGIEEFYKLTFNLIFGNLFDKGQIVFPDMNLTPNYHWYSNLPSAINLILIFFLFKKKVDFWEYLTRSVLVIYIIHILLSSISPFYSSLNTIFTPFYPWSKVFLEIFIFQVILLSLFLTNETALGKRIFVYTIYRNIIFFFYIFFFLLIIDKFLNLGFINFFLEKFNQETFSFYFYKIEFSVWVEILKDYFDKLSVAINLYIVLFYFVSIFLILLFFFKKDLIFTNNNKKYIFLSFFLLATFFSSKHFSNWQFRDDTQFVWDNYKKNLANPHNPFDRIIMIRQQNKISTYKNIDLQSFEDWKFDNKFINRELFYGYRKPNLYSFSSMPNLSPKIITNEIIGTKRDASNNFRALQFQNYENLNNNTLNNLSINYLYSFSDLKKNNLGNFKYKEVFHSDNFYVYKNENTLPYYYLPKKIKSTEGKNFNDIKIDFNEVYLDKVDFDNIKNIKFGPANIDITNVGNGSMKINYKSTYSNLLVVSDLYDKNWKIKELNKNKVYKVNYLFKGILLEPGDYQITIYYDYRKFLYGIPLSIFSIFLILYFFRKQHIFDNTNFKKKYYRI